MRKSKKKKGEKILWFLRKARHIQICYSRAALELRGMNKKKLKTYGLDICMDYGQYDGKVKALLIGKLCLDTACLSHSAVVCTQDKRYLEEDNQMKFAQMQFFSYSRTSTAISRRKFVHVLTTMEK